MTAGTSEKVVLLWCRVTLPPFSVLSSNVTREVCLYFGAWQKLVSVLTASVSLFDQTCGRWRRLWTLPTAIEVGVCSACTWVTNSTLFVCGGGESPCTSHTVNKAYTLHDGAIASYSTMSSGRNFPGIIYSSSLSAVFVFGGAVMCIP